MQNLSGFVVATGERSHRAVVDAIRSALGDRIVETGPLRLHVGESVAGFTLLTDSSLVTFEIDVANAIVDALELPAALFSTRDYGYRSGKRVSKGALTAFAGWKRKPKRPGNAEDVWRAIAGAAHKNPFESQLWPEPHAIETRPGTTIHLAPSKHTFPPRDTPSNQDTARRRRLEGMIGNLRPHPTSQGPDDGPCETLKAWRPAPLPARTDAILACVDDGTLRMKAWTSLAHDMWSRDLVLDVATARSLEPLRLKHSTSMVEQAVSYLCARLLEVPLPALTEVARLETATLAYKQNRLDLVSDFDVAAIARGSLSAPEIHRAADAARLLGIYAPGDLDAIGARAKVERNFALRVGVHGVVPDPPDTAAMLRVLDQIQPHVVVDGDGNDGYAHAHALWLSWFRLHHGEAKRDVDTPERIALRIDLALELAPMHRAALQNARVLATLIGDRGRAARATELAKPRGRKHKRA